MKAIVCEMCSSHDVVKQDGVYVCQSCGTRYSTEDAKKLMVEVTGTVTVDNSKKLENYYQLARQARENNNAQDAQKFYDLIRQEDPNDWEAGFFAVYYQAAQCKIMNIAGAANSAANAIDSTFRLISKEQDAREKSNALNTVIVYAQGLAASLSSAAVSHYEKFPNVDDANKDLLERSNAVRKIHAALESGLKKYFPEENDKLISVQKAEYDFMLDSNLFSYIAKATTLDGFKKWCAESGRVKKEVQAVDPSFGETEKKKGCYVATAVYGSYDCPQVWTLRRYRDDTLAATRRGRAFIRTYYAVSPTLVKWFGETAWFRNMWKPRLDKMVERLNAEGVQDTPYEDKEW